MQNKFNKNTINQSKIKTILHQDFGINENQDWFIYKNRNNCSTSGYIFSQNWVDPHFGINLNHNSYDLHKCNINLNDNKLFIDWVNFKTSSIWKPSQDLSLNDKLISKLHLIDSDLIKKSKTKLSAKKQWIAGYNYILSNILFPQIIVNKTNPKYDSVKPKFLGTIIKTEKLVNKHITVKTKQIYINTPVITPMDHIHTPMDHQKCSNNLCLDTPMDHIHTGTDHIHTPMDHLNCDKSSLLTKTINLYYHTPVITPMDHISVSNIQEEIKISRDTLIKCLSNLESKKLITKIESNTEFGIEFGNIYRATDILISILNLNQETPIKNFSTIIGSHKRLEDSKIKPIKQEDGSYREEDLKLSLNSSFQNTLNKINESRMNMCKNLIFGESVIIPASELIADMVIGSQEGEEVYLRRYSGITNIPSELRSQENWYQNNSGEIIRLSNQIDINASHLSIFLKLNSITRSNEDLYQWVSRESGIEISRSKIKSIINRSLNCKSSIEVAQSLMLEWNNSYEEIKNWTESINNFIKTISGEELFGWGMQVTTIESKIVIQIVEKLLYKKIFCLDIHDEFIVDSRMEEEALKIIREDLREWNLVLKQDIIAPISHLESTTTPNPILAHTPICKTPNKPVLESHKRIENFGVTQQQIQKQITIINKIQEVGTESLLQMLGE